MNANKSLNSAFLAASLSLALSGIALAQDAPQAPAAPTAPTATAPASPVVQGGPETDGSQGAAGGTLSNSPQELVPVPDVEASSLADVREKAAAAAPVMSIEDVVLKALHDNPTPKAARAQLQASLARIGTARAVGRPTGNVAGSTAYQNNSGGNSSAAAGGGSNTDNSRSDQLSLNISLPIFTGGRVKNSQRQAEALARAQLATAQQTEQELAAQTILAYLSVLQNGELLQVAQSNLDTSRERRRVSGVRFDAGAAARLEVLRADSDLSSAAQKRIAAANSYSQAKSALNILMARDPETPLQVQPITALVLPASAKFPLGEQATAIAAGGTAPSSPDLRAAAETALPSLEASRETVTAGEYGVKAQQAQRKPNIAATLTNLVRNPATFVSRFVLTAGLSVAQTLFSGGRIASQVAEAKANVAQYGFNLQGQRLQVANAIDGSLLSLDSALKRTSSADVAVLSGQEALRAAQLSFSAGAGTELDVIDAQNALVAAQTDAVNARYSVAQAQVQLAAATAITQSGSATGQSGLGSSAGTGQSSSVSSSSANQSSGINSGTTSTTGTSGSSSTLGGTNN